MYINTVQYLQRTSTVYSKQHDDKTQQFHTQIYPEKVYSVIQCWALVSSTSQSSIRKEMANTYMVLLVSQFLFPKVFWGDPINHLCAMYVCVLT